MPPPECEPLAVIICLHAVVVRREDPRDRARRHRLTVANAGFWNLPSCMCHRRPAKAMCRSKQFVATNATMLRISDANVSSALALAGMAPASSATSTACGVVPYALKSHRNLVKSLLVRDHA
jgi:hypothetical protein